MPHSSILPTRHTTEGNRVRPKYNLARVSYTVYGTFGVLLRETRGFAEERINLPFCVTLENPWIDNLPNVSCIPLGLYLCKRIDSPKFGDSFEVTGVEGRTHIIFHKGNMELDTKGCILLGRAFGKLSNTPAILESNKAVFDFMAKLEGKNEFELAITDSVGGVPYQDSVPGSAIRR